MTNAKFKSLMKKTFNANRKHKSLLNELEEEYKNRFGNNPSEVNDDFFIDTFHLGGQKLCSIDELTSAAKQANNLK